MASLWCHCGAFPESVLFRLKYFCPLIKTASNIQCKPNTSSCFLCHAQSLPGVDHPALITPVGLSTPANPAKKFQNPFLHLLYKKHRLVL